MAEITFAFKLTLLLGMFFAGAWNTVTYNWQNHYITEIDGVEYSFHHPFCQGTAMFLGEAICMLLFLGLVRFNKNKWQEEKDTAKEKGLSTDRKKYLLLFFPAICDFFVTGLQFTALIYINPSIYQMLRGGVIIIMAINTRFVLNIKLEKYQIFGCFCTFCGITCVGISNFIFPEVGNSLRTGSDMGIGIGLMLTSLIFEGGVYTAEAKILQHYQAHAFEVVGTEGFWGLLIYAIVLPILSNLPCNLGEKACVTYPAGTQATFESPALFFRQFTSSPGLGVLICLGVLSICMFNLFGISITKNISALSRAVVDACRTCAVWAFGLAVTISYPGVAFWNWENTRIPAIAVEFLGFCILFSGSAIYNQILKPSFLYPSEDEKVLLEENKEQPEEEVPVNYYRSASIPLSKGGSAQIRKSSSQNPHNDYSVNN